MSDKNKGNKRNKDLSSYLDNENVQWFIYNILKKEADKTSDGKINTGGYNQNAGNSSAFGAAQFIGSTRNNILNEYNIDAWSPDLEEQKLAIIALLDDTGQLNEIVKGDFSSQYDPKKGQWEAFHNKEGSLDKRPNKWETEYITLSDTAVFSPNESWSKIPENIRVEKENLFQNKYQGLPTEIVNPIDGVLDPTAQALGLPTSEELQRNAYQDMTEKDLQSIYKMLLDSDAAALAAGEPPALVSGEFESGPQAPQFREKRMRSQPGTQEYLDTLLDLENQGGMYKDVYYDQEKDIIENLDNQDISLDKNKDFQDYSAEPDEKSKTADPVDRNFLSKLKGQDYMGLLTDIGAYAARMAPLSRAMREASSYDEERYPRFAPILPTATLPKRDVRDAFATAQQTALQQGKLDLGALSALATQQAKETARVEENLANERVGLLNQAQQINNQLTMQEMADTAANKGAAQTMQYQTLAAMSEMGQGSLREANMRRNDQIVKQMFSNVFGDEFA